MKILFLGDSHVAGPFGHTLDKLLRESGENEVQSFGVCGSIARSFLKTPKTTCGYFEHLEKSC